MFFVGPALINILPLRLQAEPGLVVIRPFRIAPDARSPNPARSSRVERIVAAVLAMDMRTCQSELALVDRDFGQRHWQTRQVFLDRFEQVRAELQLEPGLSEDRKELIGAYF